MRFGFILLQKYVKQGYTSGGAGYVLSRGALKLIADGMNSDVKGCRKGGGAEDVNLGKSFLDQIFYYFCVK